ncbi:hypothetical protein BDB01DRAFT_532272 [Pilobolus umbonatus]|nr:hypothetical protein BDB01DRAFT_532272 [Pilobolus umbonatus]
MEETPKIPNIINQYVPTEPTQRIHTQEDISAFEQSTAFDRIVTFVIVMNKSVYKKKISDDCFISTLTGNILSMLDTLTGWMNDYPPHDNPRRFGNKAFRQWTGKLVDTSHQLMKNLLPEQLQPAIPELSEYLNKAFGNETRIDYGSGHELSFVAWLAGIALLGAFTPDDYQAIVLRIFVKYLELVRQLQRTYNLEPAGSHGVWGLDDHQFLPYVWGSSQLIEHPSLSPNSVLKHNLIEEFSSDYMYFRSIQYILQVKRGPFFEHSPMLNDIASVPTWSKVNSGMIKMYVAEVLKKVPVIQHFRFGSLFPFERKQ